jgi:hypothetical protein
MGNALMQRREGRVMGRGRKVGIALLVVLVLLIGLVVVADRVGASTAEDRLADQAQAEMKKAGVTSEGRPDVTIGGFPFLTQVLAGSYDKITISVQRPRSNNVQLDHMTLVATDVKAAASDLLKGQGPVTAGRLTGSATMSWETVKSLIELSGLPVPFDPSKLQVKVVDNKVELRLPVTLGGFSTTLRASGQVSVEGGKVQLRLTDVATEGTELPPAAKALLQQYRSRLTATIRTPQMPYKLVIKNVSTSNAGVDVTATADNIVLSG